MKVEVIKVSELEPFMRYKKLEGQFVLALHRMKELTELNLKWTKEAKILATKLKMVRQVKKFKTDKEMMKQIQRYAKW